MSLLTRVRGLFFFAKKIHPAPTGAHTQGTAYEAQHPGNHHRPQRIVFSAVVGGENRELIFDSGASIANYLTESIATTGTSCGTVEDFHPQKGKYTVNLFSLPVEVGGETVDIPFGVQPADIDRDVQMSGAVGVIGVGLYKNFQVLVDCPNRRLVLGRY